MPLASARSLSTKRLVANYDPYSAYLDLALPFDARNSIADISARIKGGGYTHPMRSNAGTISTAISKYYGSSFLGGQPDGSTARLVASAVGPFRTADFCIETWVYIPSPLPVDNFCIFYHHFDTNAGFVILVLGSAASPSSAVYFGGGASADAAHSSSSLVLDAWNHIAVTRSGSTLRIFVNGNYDVVYGGTVYSDWTHGPAGGYILNSLGTAGDNIRLQDYRIYKGTPKYTANFTPPGQMIQTP